MQVFSSLFSTTAPPAPPTAEGDNPLTGKLKGRKITPIPVYILIAGSMIAAIVGIASWIIGQRQVTALSGLMLVTNLIGAFQIYQLRPQQDMEKDIAQIGDSAAQITGVSAIIKQDVSAINQTLDKYKPEMGAEVKLIKEHEETIGRLTAELGKTQANLQKITSVYDPMNKVVSTLVEASGKVSTASEGEKAALQQLGTHLQQTQATESLFQKDEQQLKIFIESLQQLPTVMNTVSRKIQSQLKALQDEYALNIQQNESLTADIKELSGANEKLSKSENEMKELLARYEEDIQKLQTAQSSIPLDEIRRLTEELNRQNATLQKEQEGKK